ncbi:MAG: class I SAM-dependent methyltransferase [Alphaproteobacteria bacterium]|nr:class I SAM-dependent methyltransferase [Alphaproteobacteria bacterium]
MLPETDAAGMVRDTLDLRGRRVADIGCGMGALAIDMAEQGGMVCGLDPDTARIRAAHTAAADRNPAPYFMIGVAQALPFGDASMDVSMFFNSLHHVPVAHVATGLAEASRVLKPGGTLFVAEPVGMGPKFEVQRLWNDEREEWRHAYAQLGRAETWNLEAQREMFFGKHARFRDFAAYADDVRGRSAHHAALVDRHEAELRRRFETLGRRDGDTVVLDGVVRLNLFRKSG